LQKEKEKSLKSIEEPNNPRQDFEDTLWFCATP
jgi:hypothetical protein